MPCGFFHPGKSNLQTQDLVVDYNINIRVSMTENNCSRMSTFVAVAQKTGYTSGCANGFGFAQYVTRNHAFLVSQLFKAIPHFQLQ